ncbi:MAG: LysR family transcriptional regulator [Pseudomonadota bacterium]
MTIREPDWDLYRSFLAVLNEGSLSGAARALGLTQPTVGRHIDMLEQALALTLFIRSQTGYMPTEAAAGLRDYAETLASTSAALLRAASSLGRSPHGELHGTVRITASDVIGVEVLPPILSRLQRDCPGIAIELAISNRIENLLRRDADIAVRMQRPQQEALLARRIGAIELGLHAHRDYLQARGTPHTWAELAQHVLIGIDHETPFTRSLAHHMGDLSRDNYALRSDSDLVQLASIRAGLGIGICQTGLARRDPALVRVLPEALAIRLDTWLAMHENLRNNPACKAVYAALAEGLAPYLEAEDG